MVYELHLNKADFFNGANTSCFVVLLGELTEDL